RFFFEDVPAGEQQLIVDPSTVPTDVIYTPLHYRIQVVPGAPPNGVGSLIALTRVDPASRIEFPSSKVLSNPNLPGLVTDFSDSTLRNPDGTIFAGTMTLSPVIPSNVPMPFPSASTMFWTVQPAVSSSIPRRRSRSPSRFPWTRGSRLTCGPSTTAATSGST